MDLLFDLRTVDFIVWISYLDVHFDYANAVTRLTVDRADAHVTPAYVFQINNSHRFQGDLQTSMLTKRVHFYYRCVQRIPR